MKKIVRKYYFYCLGFVAGNIISIPITDETFFYAIAKGFLASIIFMILMSLASNKRKS